MIILYVDATYDYKSHYAPCVDKKLGGYGYSSDEVGYHWLQHVDSKQHSDTGIAFKKYQSGTFVDIALQRKDVPASERPPPEPCGIHTPPAVYRERLREGGRLGAEAHWPTGRRAARCRVRLRQSHD